MPGRRRLSCFALVAVVAASLTACQLGERPYFSDDPFPPGLSTGDANIDVVLDLLDDVTRGPVTADYAILRKYGAAQFSGQVALSGGQRVVVLGNTRYLQTEPVVQTCALDGSRPCVDGIVAQAASDVGLTIDFYAADTATRLRRDAQAKAAPTTGYQETFGDQNATCVDVPLAGGTAVYCALDNGMLAKLDDGDVLVTLTAFVPSAELVLFEPGD